MGSVLLLLAPGEGDEEEDPREEPPVGKAAPAGAAPMESEPCVTAEKQYGCEVSSGTCRKGHVLWDNPDTVRLYNVVVESAVAYAAAREEFSLASDVGETGPRELEKTVEGRIQACGKPDLVVICGGNSIIHAIVQPTGMQVPTKKDVTDAIERASEKALEAAKGLDCKEVKDSEGEDCPFAGKFAVVWTAGFAVDLTGGEMAGLFNAAWDAMAGDVRGRGGEDPGPSPLQMEGGSYYVCAAAQVEWHCARSPLDIPPPPREPEDPIPPVTGGRTTTEPGPEPDPLPGPRSFAGPPGEIEPAPTGGCVVKDDAGKCCYGYKSGNRMICQNYACRGSWVCAPNKAGDDCECVPPEVARRLFLDSVDHSDENLMPAGEGPKAVLPPEAGKDPFDESPMQPVEESLHDLLPNRPEPARALSVPGYDPVSDRPTTVLPTMEGGGDLDGFRRPPDVAIARK
jgi:hypothetical protein